MSPQEVQDAAMALGEEAHEVSGSTPADDVLRDAADRARSFGVEQVDTVAVVGDPVEQLVEIVDRGVVDLLVVGSRGLNGLAGQALGSVPTGLTARAACDVLIVHTDTAALV